jgi:hypothetical protein
MKLFGFNKKQNKSEFLITEPDRLWVEESFKWLTEVLGLPSKTKNPILITENFFPKTFSTEKIDVHNLIEDLSSLLNLDPSKIKFKIQDDARDFFEVPVEIKGQSLETEIEITDNHYTIYIASSIAKRTNRLFFNLIYEFVKIRLTENNLVFDSGDDTSLFIYIAGIHMGFGIPLAQNLKDFGQSSNGSWDTQWNNTSEMHPIVMGFSLATYSLLREENEHSWKEELPKEIEIQFDKALNYISTKPSSILTKPELDKLDQQFRIDQGLN